MQDQHIRTPAPCLRARCLAMRPVGSPRWLPSAFRTKADLRRCLLGSDFRFLDFDRSTWVITPDGVPLEIRIVRPTGRTRAA